jgi:hypothetical protein
MREVLDLGSALRELDGRGDKCGHGPGDVLAGE